jgi:uncharacterized repeat protein (TIGR01451 family)/LPXTG-motif cell wall-anchored protein
MKNFSKAMLGTAAAVATVSATVAPVANVAAWGDNANGRTVYTVEQVNAGALGDKITFNSITNGSYKDVQGKTHQIGDERNFLSARLNGTSNVWSANEITAEDGKEYVLSLYVHNNSPKGTAAVAKDTTVSFSIPGNTATSVQVDGVITSSNATPTKYWDDVVFKSANGAKFHLEYIAGSASWESNGKSAGKLSDSVITSAGAKVGYDALDGNLPGCYGFSGYAGVHVKVVYDEEFTITKQVRIKGTTEWKESVDAKVGDVVEYMIGYTNKSGATVSNVMVLDSLPSNMEYVAGSTKVKNGNHPAGVKMTDETITTTGLNIGGYNNGANAYILFEAKVVDKNLTCNKKNQLVNWAKITAAGVTKKDDASVVVPKVCDTPDPEPMPQTGAHSIIVSALGLGTTVTALGVYVASRKKLM